MANIIFQLSRFAIVGAPTKQNCFSRKDAKDKKEKPLRLGALAREKKKE